MPSQRRNLMVAVTVLGSLAILGWMILRFGGTLGGFVAGGGYPVDVRVPRVDGLSQGGRVMYRGVSVGRVAAIRLSEDRTGFDVRLEIRDDRDLMVPANVIAAVRATNLISGGAAVDLELDGEVARGDLREVSGPLPGIFTGSDLVPPEISRLGEEMRLLVTEFRASGLVANLNDQVLRIGELADSMNALVGDGALQTDVRDTVASARATADSVRRISADFEDLSSRLQSLQEEAGGLVTDARGTVEETNRTVIVAREQLETAGRQVEELQESLLSNLQRTDAVLADTQRLMRKLDEGRGTAGQLLNDTRLYEGLVDNVRILTETTRTAQRLVEQWEQEGLTVRIR